MPDKTKDDAVKELVEDITHEDAVKQAYAAADKAGLSKKELQEYANYHYDTDLELLSTQTLVLIEETFSEAAASAEPVITKDGSNTKEVAKGDAYKKDIFQTKRIKRPFTQEEIDGMTERLIDEMTTLEELETDRKNYLDESRGKISDQEATISQLHHMIRDGFETSDREVRIVRDFDSGYRKIYDVATGKFVGTEPLTPHDRQVDMDDALEENKRREEEALATETEVPDTESSDDEEPSDGS